LGIVIFENMKINDLGLCQNGNKKNGIGKVEMGIWKWSNGNRKNENWNLKLEMELGI
jgi:hypothetical protein